MAEHISKQFDADLEAVRANVLQMGGLVEQQISQALEALIQGNVPLAERVVADDARVNALELAIDQDCSELIARRQPAAGDLRLVLAIVKTITDLERIGDEADKMARMAKMIHTSDRLNVPRLGELKYIGDTALDMLRKSLDAFARLDAKAALQVLRLDDQVDASWQSIIRQLITFMMEDPRTISTSIEILFAAKAAERIGDHAKNMAEHVIYLVKGTDVRHATDEEVQRALES
jgi:phosphate transport system protein